MAPVALKDIRVGNSPEAASRAGGVDLSPVRGQLERYGWYQYDSSEQRVGEAIARCLGMRVEGVHDLMPRSMEEGRSKSLSGAHGYGPFPFHTDTAHWLQPANIIVLQSIIDDESKRATVLLDSQCLPFSRSDVECLERAVFSVRNGRRSFLSEIRPHGGDWIRFDLGCMRPITKCGHSAIRIVLNAIDRAKDRATIEWSAGRVLVFDNSRMLHARTEADYPARARHLRRWTLVQDAI